MLFLASLCVGLVRSHLSGNQFGYAYSDGQCYYLWAESMALDGDLNHSNNWRDADNAALPGGYDNRFTPRGYVLNKYPIGFGLSILPALLPTHWFVSVIHAASGSSFFEPDGRSPPYMIASAAVISLYATWTMCLLHRLLTRRLRYSPEVAMLAVVCFALSSHYFHYTVRNIFMPHVVGFFWVVLFIELSRQAVEVNAKASRWYFLLFGASFAASMAVVVRPTNLLLILPFSLTLVPLILTSLPAQSAIQRKILALFGSTSSRPMLKHGTEANATLVIRSTPQSTERLPTLRFVFPLLWALTLGLTPIALQIATWRITFGQWIVFSYANESFNWLDPKPILSLFSQFNGLFVYSPMFLLGSVCTVAFWRSIVRISTEARTIFACAASGAIALTYANSCWWNWWFGNAFGGRAYTEAGLIVVIGLASLFDFASRSNRARWIVASLIAVIVVYTFTLFAAVDLGKVRNYPTSLQEMGMAYWPPSYK